MTLLKREEFSWTQGVTNSFEKLEAMGTTPILATLDFTKIFTVECDSSSHGIDIVLMQG